MNEHEKKFISSFLLKEKQDRYVYLLSNIDSGRRSEGLNRLNHCHDLNENYVTWLNARSHLPQTNNGIAEYLQRKGSPNKVYVIGGSDAVDGKTMALAEAIDTIQQIGWGAIISCIPGQLAYYYDEEGERRAILARISER